MSNRKFFTGLPHRMEARAGHGPDRMKTQFYWPDDASSPDVVQPMVRRGSRSSKDSGGGGGDAWQYNYDTADENSQVIRERKKKQLSSRIEFYDFVDEPKVNGKVKQEAPKQEEIPAPPLSPERPQEEVKSVPVVVTEEEKPLKNGTSEPPERVQEQFRDMKLRDGYEDSDEEYFERRRTEMARNIRRPPPPPSSEDRMRRRPDYYEDDYYPRRRMSPRRDYHYESDSEMRRYGPPPPLPRRPRYYEDEYYYRPPPPPPTPRAYPDDYEPIDRDFYYEEPAPAPPRHKPPIKNNGHVEASPSTAKNAPTSSPKPYEEFCKRPPARSVSRAMSVCSDAPSEARMMAGRHLRSNIFFNDREALATQPRPPTIRESATSRVCVGLPDLG